MGRKGLFVIAIGVVAVGFVVLGSLTSAEPAALEETTTTSTTLAEVLPPIDLENFSIDQIETGPQFEWERTLNVVEGYPIALLHHQEMLYLFSTDVPNFSGFDSNGLYAWRSTDGVTWEPLGRVIDPNHAITTVTSTGQGLVALERTQGRSGFTVWQSSNGEVWTADEVVLDLPDELATVYPVAAGGTESLLVVTGHVTIDVNTLIRERLGEIAAYGWGVDVFNEQVQITLQGPLGLSVAVMSADELGLSQEEQRRIVDSYRTGSVSGAASGGHVWAKREGSGWQQADIGNAWIESVTTMPDGTFVGHGWGNGGATTWRSTDGLGWEETTSGRYELAEGWRDRGVAFDREGGVSVLVSEKGQDWEDIGPSDHFPVGIEWSIARLAAGTDGVAALVWGWNPRQSVSPADPSSSPTLTSNGSTLTLDVSTDELRIEKGDDTYIWRPSYSTTPQEGIEFDVDTMTIRFLDTQTDELLAAFPLDELMDLESRARAAAQGEGVTHHALAFTANGTDWTIQEAVSPDGRSFRLLAITGSHIVVAGIDAGGSFNPTSPPGFGVWSAALP